MMYKGVVHSIGIHIKQAALLLNIQHIGWSLLSLLVSDSKELIQLLILAEPKDSFHLCLKAVPAPDQGTANLLPN